MSRPAILAEAIGKRYVIGAGYRTPDTLGETLANAVTRARASFTALAGGKRPLGHRPKTEEFWALRDISFEVPHGQVLGIIGRNGSGKSTLLKILARITPPTEGEATIVGRVGSLLEIGTGFHGELTGRENIFLSGTILGMKTDEITRRFDEIVDFSGVEKFIDTPVKHYSSGMYLRLAFAVAAHLRTEILLIDEVLAVGDASFQKKCIERMSEVASEGRTVLFVSHNLPAVSRLCDMGLVLDEGKITAKGTIDEAVAAYGRLLETKDVTDDSCDGDGVNISALKFGTEGTSLDSSLPMEFSFTLAVRRKYWNLLVYVVLATHEGSNIVVEVIDGERFSSLLEPGRYRVEVSLPPLWLRPRGYTFSVKVITHPADGLSERYLSDRKDVVITCADDVDGSWERLLAPQAVWAVNSLEDVGTERFKHTIYREGEG